MGRQEERAAAVLGAGFAGLQRIRWIPADYLVSVCAFFSPVLPISPAPFFLSVSAIHSPFLVVPCIAFRKLLFDSFGSSAHEMRSSVRPTERARFRTLRASLFGAAAGGCLSLLPSYSALRGWLSLVCPQPRLCSSALSRPHLSLLTSRLGGLQSSKKSSPSCSFSTGGHCRSRGIL